MTYLNFRSSLVGAMTFAMLLLTTSAKAQSSGNAPFPQEGILLLQNGQLFSGRITQSGDRYDVAVEGGIVSIPAYEVDCWCRSLDEAYMAQRTRWNQNDVESHFQLAAWCHRQGLFVEAESELRAAEALDPNNPRIRLIQNRLVAARIQSSRKARPVELNTQADSISDMNRLIDQMPPGTVEVFTRSIQPILLNGCTTAGCHGPNTAHGVEFLRAPFGQAPSQQLTRRNLQQTLKWVDREKPSESALLTVPIQPHGTARSAIFSKQHQDQYERIIRWVQHLSLAQDPIPKDLGQESGQESDQESDPILQASHASTENAEKTVSAVFTTPLSLEKGFRSVDPLGGSPFDDAISTFGSAAPRVKRGASVKQFSPTDPFDPEIFNRRYFRRTQ